MEKELTLSEKLKLPKMNLQLFADDDGEGKKNTSGSNADGKNESDSAKEGNNSAGDSSSNSGQESEPEKKFSQADLDKAIKDRLARENKKFQKQIDDLKKQFTAGGDSEGNADAGGNQDDQSSANDQSARLLAAANLRLVEATATTEAVKLGADPKFIADVVKLANLSDIEIGENGEIDSAKISKAIDEVLKRVPAFKTTVENGGGFKIGGDGSGGQSNPNSWGKKDSKQVDNTKRWNRTNRNW